MAAFALAPLAAPRILELRLAFCRAEIIGDASEDADGARAQVVDLFSADRIFAGHGRTPYWLTSVIGCMPKKRRILVTSEA